MRIPAPVRCVLFDAVGTLIYADPPVSAVYEAAAHDLGLNLDEGTVKGRFAEAFAKHNAANSDDTDESTDEARERDRWRMIVAAVFPEIVTSDALFERLWNHFAQSTSWRLYDDVTECFERLTNRGLALGVASNFDERLVAICRSLPPLDRSQHIFMSSRIGYRKPAAQFFHAIERAMALKPQHLMLIGDDWQSDYLAATAAGWNAVHLDRQPRGRMSMSVRSLIELL